MSHSSSSYENTLPVSDRNELRALIALLDDPDTFVQEKVKERMSEFGENHVPILDELREDISDPVIRKRVTELIHNITFPALELEFAEYLDNGIHTMRDLERGQLLLSRLDNPTLRTDLYRRQMDKMASRLEPCLRAQLSPSEQLESFTSFFFEQEFFKGAHKDYRHPDNSYLHKVLQRRRGIPIALSMVMLFVADRLDFPLYGVNMPMHFLIKYEAGNDSALIDPFNCGRIVSMGQCSYFLESNGITPEAAHFERATERTILVRSIRNLIISYEEMQNSNRVQELKRLLEYLKPEGGC